MKWSSEDTDIDIDEGIVDSIMKVHDSFVNSEVGHEAWMLEDRALTFSIAECLHGSVQLHLDSFAITAPELRSKIDVLLSQLWNVGDLLRASLLGKPISELTERDRAAIGALLPGRHIKNEL
jgi:hypothetical protein